MQDNRKLKRKVRNSYIISTVSIALVLFLLGSVGYLILTALDATDRMKESVSLYVMLDSGVTPELAEDIGALLKEEEAVREVVFVSKDQAAADFREYAGSDFSEFLDFNPLPDSYEVKLSTAGSSEDMLADFERRVAGWEGVDEVVYQRNVVSQIGSNINKFNLILLVFGAALLVISLILLNNTIRVTIYSKRYIISTMKLVGAKKWFIIKPFAGSALLQGIYAAILAAAMFLVLIWGLHEGLPEIRFAAGRIQIAIIIGGMFILGILISLLFTIFAVNKFVKMPTNAIHLY